MDHGKIVWPDASSVKQYFSIPNSLIYYIAKNPSSHKLYSKLIQTCKYFFEKNSILVAPKFQDCKDGINSLICVNKYLECKKNKKQCCIKIDTKKLKSKIWIIAEFDMDYGDQNSISLILSKLYRCELYHFGLTDKIVMFDDLKFFTSAKEVILLKTSIKYNDGRSLMLEKAIECFPNVEYLECDIGENISCITASTMANISKHPNAGNFKDIVLFDTPEIKDLSFKGFNNDTKIWLKFNSVISEAYKEQLDAFIDEIIESEVKYRWILYDGQDGEKCEIMHSRFGCNCYAEDREDVNGESDDTESEDDDDEE
uniref:Uncharacterized protein n=1 Tax=Panagrolaimus sp. PS1159 TaxID=55785 RepID=A0AC35ERJ8_9BILA